MNEDLFWDTFVQCFVCKDIMLRLGMFAAHRCQVDTGAANPRSSTRSPRNSRSLIRPHLLSIPGDIPEVRPLRSMSRFSSPTPTEIISDSEAGSSDDGEARAGPSRFPGAVGLGGEIADSDDELPSILSLFRRDA